jgi:hypothetical protein
MAVSRLPYVGSKGQLTDVHHRTLIGCGNFLLATKSSRTYFFKIRKPDGVLGRISDRVLLITPL